MTLINVFIETTVLKIFVGIFVNELRYYLVFILYEHVGFYFLLP